MYNVAEKQNQQAQFAVLDISVGNKNLQQCADAVMRSLSCRGFKVSTFILKCVFVKKPPKQHIILT